MSNTELSLIPLTEEQKQGAQMLLDWLDARFQICQHDATMYQIIIGKYPSIPSNISL